MGWLVCRRTHQLRHLIYRVCLNEAPTARSELRGTPHARAPQVARRRSRRDAVSRGAFAWVTFILRKMKVTAPPGAHPGICASAQKWRKQRLLLKTKSILKQDRRKRQFSYKSRAAHLHDWRGLVAGFRYGGFAVCACIQCGQHYPANLRLAFEIRHRAAGSTQVRQGETTSYQGWCWPRSRKRGNSNTPAFPVLPQAWLCQQTTTSGTKGHSKEYPNFHSYDL